MHKNLNKLVVGQWNINSIRNMFDFVAHQGQGIVDILMILETKLDGSFPLGKFLLDGYSIPYLSDGIGIGRGILLFIRQDIPSKLLPMNNDLEFFFFS